MSETPGVDPCVARRPSFDRDVVLDRAIDVFWRHGYQGASLTALVEATGLLPGSIYAAFGSKEALFREVLTRYVEHARAHVASGDLPARALLERWFATLIDAALSVPAGELGRGCLLLASTAEAPRLDRESAELVRAQVDALERFFRQCITEARRDRPRSGALSASATARLLVASLVGISAMSRAGVSRQALEDVARAALSNV